MSELTELHKEVAVCQRCELAKGRTKTVPGEGPENAEIMFIGEAPASTRIGRVALLWAQPGSFWMSFWPASA